MQAITNECRVGPWSPTDHEKGAFLTLDLGGTNLPVCWIILSGQRGGSKITQSQYTLPPQLKTGNAEELWDYIADSLWRFIPKRHFGGDDDNPLPLGFTFSYPATQGYIDHGVLQTWTKGFDIKESRGFRCSLPVARRSD